MKKCRIFVIVPSLIPTGPIKGAAALCNGLVDHFPVTLVPLKKGFSKELIIDSQVKIASIVLNNNWVKKCLLYQKLLQEGGSRYNVVSISFCFSADVINSLMADIASTISNVRGNLYQNYRFEYGPAGYVLAQIHYMLLRRFSAVVAISDTMSSQVRNFRIKKVKVIGNFLDEEYLETFQIKRNNLNHSVNFVFLASLSKRKRPDLVIKSIHALIKKGYSCHLDIIGDGLMRHKLLRLVQDLNVTQHVTFHGFLSEPYSILQNADFMVLPSESEGVSRAVMESLFFGVPCILRNVDANKEIIKDNYNGFLFRNDSDILKVMKKAINSTKTNANNHRNILLPQKFRQKNCIEQYISLIESLL